MRKVGLFVVLIALMTSSLYAQDALSVGEVVTMHGEQYYCFDVRGVAAIGSNGEFYTKFGEASVSLSIVRRVPGNSTVQIMYYNIFPADTRVLYPVEGSRKKIFAMVEENINMAFLEMCHVDTQIVHRDYDYETSVTYYEFEWPHNTITIYDEYGGTLYSGIITEPSSAK